MSRSDCWAIENYEYRRCRPSREFRSLVSLHNHSSHSIENMASLGSVMARWFMWPLRRIVQCAFGLASIRDLDYAELRYNPPYTPEEVLRLESDAVRPLDFDHVQLAITDHDEIAGSLELRKRNAACADRIAVGEELSVSFDHHLFHLGITGLRENRAPEIHGHLQAAASAGRLDDLFEVLRAADCLVVLNHPLLPWSHDCDSSRPASELLKRYGWAIHALEYNGMRPRRENDAVLKLARQSGKPVVGGGDSHLLLASSAICGSTGADTFAGFIEEVKSGRAVPIIRSHYFAPLGWKLLLRVMFFMGHYRRIACFRGQPVREMLDGRRVLLDPVGALARGFLALSATLGLTR